MKLLKLQKQEIWDIMLVAGFNPLDFEITENSEPYENSEILIKYKPESNFDFEIAWSGDEGGYYVIYSPGENTLVTSGNVSRELDFNNYLPDLKIWLQYLHRELNASDPWDNLNYTFGGPPNKNELPTNDIVKIRQGIDEIIRRLPETGIKSSQQEQLIVQFNQVINIAEKTSVATPQSPHPQTTRQACRCPDAMRVKGRR